MTAMAKFVEVGIAISRLVDMVSWATRCRSSSTSPDRA
jgi:hypothetical protein